MHIEELKLHCFRVFLLRHLDIGALSGKKHESLGAKKREERGEVLVEG